MEERVEKILDGEPFDDLTQDQLQEVLNELSTLKGLSKYLKNKTREQKIIKYMREITNLLEPPEAKTPSKTKCSRNDNKTPKKLLYQAPKSPISRKTHKIKSKAPSVTTECSVSTEISEEELTIYQEYVEELINDKEFESGSEESKFKLVLTCKRMKDECIQKSNFEKANKLDSVISKLNEKSNIGYERRQARLEELTQLRENLVNRIQAVKEQYESDLAELKELHREAIDSFNETIDQEKYELEEKSFNSSFAEEADETKIEEGSLEKALIRMKDYEQLKLVRKENKLRRKMQREAIEEQKHKKLENEIDKFKTQILIRQKAFDDRWEEKYRKLEENAIFTADRLSAKLKAIDEQILFYEKKQL